MELQSRKDTKIAISIDWGNQTGIVNGRESKLTANSAKKTLKKWSNQENIKSYIPVRRRHNQRKKHSLVSNSSIESNGQMYIVQK